MPLSDSEKGYWCGSVRGDAAVKQQARAGGGALMNRRRARLK